MKHGLPIPVEPLSERRWQEIRNEVLAQAAEMPLAEPRARRVTRSPRVAPVLALVAVAAAAFLWLARLDAPPSEVASHVETSRVVTDASSATASAGDVTLELSAHTSVLVVQLAPEQWLVSIEHGGVRFLVPPRGERPEFAVEAGRTRVVVIGTAFSVSRAPGAPSGTVEVEHGVVRVEDLADVRVLHDGESWPARSVSVPSQAEPPAPAPEASVVVLDRGERAAAPPTRTAPATSIAPEVATPAPTTSAADRYREAEAAESQEPAHALELYAALADEGGPWSAAALFAEARLEYELHHEPQARSLSERYLAAHPDGINAEDARELLRRIP